MAGLGDQAITGAMEGLNCPCWAGEQMTSHTHSEVTGWEYDT